MNMRERKDQGAVAVMVALLAIVLFGISAFAVDLSNAFARERWIQAQADFAALAGGGELSGTKSVTDPAVLAAVSYLNSNHPPDDDGFTTVTASHLVDGPVADPNKAVTEAAERNGEVYFESPTRLRVIAPQARVNFGLANVFGYDRVDLNAEATVGIFSPGTAVMPLYAVSGCDQGPQAITDPASGHVATSVPPLSHASESNSSTLDTPTSTAPNPSPVQVDVNPATTTVTIRGGGLGGATRVGFFKEGDGVNAPPEPVVLSGADISHPASGQISFQVPITGVTDQEGLWWIRVWGPSNGSNPDQWSAVQRSNGDLNTLPFRVGTPYLRCAGGSNQGNYGALKLPRTDVSDSTTNGWLPTNMARGLQLPLSLQIYPGNNATDALCDPSDGSPTVYSTTTGTPNLLPHTNCVDTDTGLPANSATAGMITGTTGSNASPGRLDKPTTPGCDPGGGSDQRTVILGPSSTKLINDDILTCYFEDSTATVADVSHFPYTYNGATPIVSEKIFESPRFFWQPVLGVRPGTGGSQHYKIVDMRPAFLTDQPLSASKASPQVGPDNGLTVVNGSVTEMRVVFLNIKAIKQPDGGPVIDWLGGDLPKLIRLVN